MKKYVLIISLAALINGCRSSSTEIANNGNLNPNNSNFGGNAKLVPLPGVNSADFNANSANIPVVNRKADNTQPISGPQPAPDDSVFQTLMNEKGEVFETRSFRNHPQIVKIERKTVNATRTLKVYLKNGKVYDLSEEKVPDFRVAAPQNVLVAIGVVSPSNPQTDPKKEKKLEKDGQ